MQMWKTDGTALGTVRAFDQTANDLDLDLDALDSDWPPQFGVFDHTLYFPSNEGRGAGESRQPKVNV